MLKHILILLLCCFTLEATSQRQKRMVRDLESLANSFDVHYALKDWKRENINWDLEVELEKAKQHVLERENITIKEFQQLVASFCKSVKDYHVKAFFYSTESSSLPFVIKGSEGRYFINAVADQGFPFKIGDEITAFDGVPIQLAIQKLKDELGYDNYEPTDNHLAEYVLTCRLGSSGHAIPQGDVSFTIKTKRGEEITYKTEWNYGAEIITHQINLSKTESNIHNREWRVPNAQNTPKKRPLPFGNTKTVIPPLSKKLIWRAWEWSPFNGRVYQVGAHRIGFIRIHDYSIGDPNNVEDFRQTIAQLERNSDLLVIDQTGNPGGSPLYLFTLLTMLTEEPLQVPHEQVLLNKHHIAMAYQTVQKYRSDPTGDILGFAHHLRYYPHKNEAIQALLQYHMTLIQEWHSRHVFSDPIPFFGFDDILPHPQTRYTKPIIVLVDELDFSCADLFPAILQDNKRALIFGARTAGAGGSQSTYSYPNHYGVESIQLTHSLFHRTRGGPIENSGVTPDVLYELKAEDLQQKCNCYKQALISTIEGLLNEGAN